jgi:hypothetical protein
MISPTVMFGGVGNNGIRADKAAYRRVIISGVVVVKAGAIRALAGE